MMNLNPKALIDKQELLTQFTRLEDGSLSPRENLINFYMKATQASQEKAEAVVADIQKGQQSFVDQHEKLSQRRDGIPAVLGERLSASLKDQPLPQQYAALRNLRTCLRSSSKEALETVSTQLNMDDLRAQVDLYGSEEPYPADNEITDDMIRVLINDISEAIPACGSLSLLTLLADAHAGKLSDGELGQLLKRMGNQTDTDKEIAGLWTSADRQCRSALADQILFEKGVSGYPDSMTPELFGVNAAAMDERIKVLENMAKGVISPEVARDLFATIAAAAYICLSFYAGLLLLGASFALFDLTLMLIIPSLFLMLVGVSSMECAAYDLVNFQETKEKALAYTDTAIDAVKKLWKTLKALLTSLPERIAQLANGGEEAEAATNPHDDSSYEVSY